ncbi:hypothetical protein K523DRAFT_366723 [Schizophyllum commune Tattone D]|nr:hypothetical protein K523DRAFT_366723 [Schizophyllum commune Tattone D]
MLDVNIESPEISMEGAFDSLASRQSKDGEESTSEVPPAEATKLQEPEYSRRESLEQARPVPSALTIQPSFRRVRAADEETLLIPPRESGDAFAFERERSLRLVHERSPLVKGATPKPEKEEGSPHLPDFTVFGGVSPLASTSSVFVNSAFGTKGSGPASPSLTCGQIFSSKRRPQSPRASSPPARPSHGNSKSFSEKGLARKLSTRYLRAHDDIDTHTKSSVSTPEKESSKSSAANGSSGSQYGSPGSGGSRIWRLVERISTGALRDKADWDKENTKAPPVPAIPSHLREGSAFIGGPRQSDEVRSTKSKARPLPVTRPGNSSPEVESSVDDKFFAAIQVVYQLELNAFDADGPGQGHARTDTEFTIIATSPSEELTALTAPPPRRRKDDDLAEFGAAVADSLMIPSFSVDQPINTLNRAKMHTPPKSAQRNLSLPSASDSPPSLPPPWSKVRPSLQETREPGRLQSPHAHSFSTSALKRSKAPPVTFCELGSSPAASRSLSEKEKAARWDDLLLMSERAGGTIHLGSGGLPSDQLRFSTTSFSLDALVNAED